MKITIPLTPVPKGRAVPLNGRMVTPEKTRRFEKAVRLCLMGQEKLTGPISMTLIFKIAQPKSVKRKYPCVRPDLDNYCKAILDAAEGILFENDGQICGLALGKDYCQGGEQPNIEIRMQEIK